MRNGKITILIERKLNENFAKMKNFREKKAENVVENTSKFAKIFNENERISFNENCNGNPNSDVL